MKKLLKVLILLLLVAPLVCVEAQRPKLTETDKKQILRIILSTTDFGGGDVDPNGRTIVYFQNDVIPAQYLPKVKGIHFVSITKQEIAGKRKLKEGIGYFSFDKFIRGNGFVRISLFWDGFSPNHGNGWEMIYTCRKKNGRWKLKHQYGSVWVSEGE